MGSRVAGDIHAGNVADHNGTRRRGLHLMAQRLGAGDFWHERRREGWGAAASSTMVPLGSLRASQGWRLQRLRSVWVRFSKFSAPQDKASPIALRISAGVWGGAIANGRGGTTIIGAVVTSGAEARGTTGWMSRMVGPHLWPKRLRSSMVLPEVSSPGRAGGADRPHDEQHEMWMIATTPHAKSRSNSGGAPPHSRATGPDPVINPGRGRSRKIYIASALAS